MNHGRWVVDCPRDECGWAYLAMNAEGKPRYTWICAGHGASGGCGTRIDLCWPPLDAALEIERLLYSRRAPANRNWRFPETVDGLDHENETLLVGWTLEKAAAAGIGTI